MLKNGPEGNKNNDALSQKKTVDAKAQKELLASSTAKRTEIQKQIDTIQSKENSERRTPEQIDREASAKLAEIERLEMYAHMTNAERNAAQCLEGLSQEVREQFGIPGSDIDNHLDRHNSLDWA